MFYFDRRTWWKLVRMVRRTEDPARRRRQYRTLLLTVPSLALLHTIAFALDPVLFPSLKDTQVRRPVFVTAHARSGTTYLHRMMTADPRASYPLLWEMFFPSLIEKRVLRWVLAMDLRLGGRLRRRLDRLDERLFAKSNAVHESGLFAAEEDDFLLTLSCASGFWVLQFPYVEELDLYYVDERFSERRRRKLMGFYRECVRRQLHLDGQRGDQALIYLSKSPIFCGRVNALIETFPEARFVVPLRNPYETIPSLLKLMQFAWSARGRTEADVRTSMRRLAQDSFHNYRHPLEVLEAHPEVPRSIVSYADLVRDPAETMRRVYHDIDLEIPPELDRALAHEHGRAYRSGHAYSLEEFGLEADAIRQELAPLFERYGWDQDDGS